jgi:uncharacterized protein
MIDRSGSVDTLTVDRPVRIERPTMLQRWSALSFVHWAYEPRAVTALLPPGLTIDTFDGAAWVGLIPFRLQIRRPGTPYARWLSDFPETNLRTYVVGPDGRRGIWFLSLDAARLGAVMIARTSYRLPYMWAHAEMHERDGVIRYRGRRRWPRTDATYDVSVEIGGRRRTPTALDRFLTERWHLFSPGRLRLPPMGLDLVRTTVTHPPWPLRDARVVRVEQTLLAAAGLPEPLAAPSALFSPGVGTRFAARVPLAR